jgi:hypothetical protein
MIAMKFTQNFMTGLCQGFDFVDRMPPSQAKEIIVAMRGVMLYIASVAGLTMGGLGVANSVSDFAG